MGNRTRFARSELGSRVRSPLGAFIGYTDNFLEIFTVPLFVEDAETYIITGENFGSTQGTGLVQIGDNPFFDSSTTIVSQTVNSWGDSSIEIDAVVDGVGLSGDGLIWFRVTGDNGQYDSAIAQIVVLTGQVSGNSINAITSGMHNYYDVEVCSGASVPMYCGPGFSLDGIFDESVGYGDWESFVVNSPGFVIYGTQSTNVVYFNSPALYSAGTGGNYWPNPSEGLVGGLSGTGLILPYSFAGCDGTCPDDPGGWDAPAVGTGESFYIAPIYPLTVQITSPADSSTQDSGSSILFEGYSFAEEGDISSSITWTSDIDGAIGTGASFSTTLSEDDHEITATSVNFDGQQRVSVINITVASIAITVSGVSPTSGVEAGGTSVLVVGENFTADCLVYFDGVVASNISYINPIFIGCDTPAGTGLVDVTVTDTVTMESGTLANGFTYT